MGEYLKFARISKDQSPNDPLKAEDFIAQVRSDVIPVYTNGTMCIILIPADDWVRDVMHWYVMSPVHSSIPLERFSPRNVSEQAFRPF